MKDQKSISELKKDVESLREEIAKLRFEHSLGKLKDTSQLKKKRRELARVLTEIRQKEIIGGQDV